MEINYKIKPLSVNDCSKGRRFKTPEYRGYESLLMYDLPEMEIPSPPFQVWFEFGFSNAASDIDNPVKPLQDVLQKKYRFNDKDIYRSHTDKVVVKKGEDYFKFKIENFDIKTRLLL